MSDTSETLRRARRERLFGDLPLALRWGGRELRRLLPHRPPMLLLDAIVATDDAGARAIGTRVLDPADPIFGGHFPGDPVYPGALLVELSGQLGLCLGPHLAAGEVPARPRPVRLLRIHGAEFVAPARPGDALTVLAEQVEDDGWTLRLTTQVLRGDTILCAASLEAMWTEDP